MPLYDVTNPFKPSRVKSKDAANYDVIQAVKRKVHTSTKDKIIRTIDSGVLWAIDRGVNRARPLVWTKSAALFGHGSPLSHTDVEHLWKHVVSSVGDGKECLQAVGGFLR